MKVLVVARTRKTAQAWVKQSPRLEGCAVVVAIYGENVAGQTFDRIYCLQQDKATPAALQHLIFRIVMGGRFERVS